MCRCAKTAWRRQSGDNRVPNRYEKHGFITNFRARRVPQPASAAHCRGHRPGHHPVAGGLWQPVRTFLSGAAFQQHSSCLASSQPAASRRTSTCGEVRSPARQPLEAALGRTASQPSLPGSLSLHQNRFSSQLNIWEVRVAGNSVTFFLLALTLLIEANLGLTLAV